MESTKGCDVGIAEALEEVLVLCGPQEGYRGGTGAQPRHLAARIRRSYLPPPPRISSLLLNLSSRAPALQHVLLCRQQIVLQSAAIQATRRRGVTIRPNATIPLHQCEPCLCCGCSRA